MKTVAFTTLGCKVNQYDTDAMKGLFLKGDYEVIPFEEEADIYVVNTCSVTNMGEKKSRQIIRQAQRRNPEAKIVVTGCYAQLNPEAIAAIDGVNLVIGTSNRHRVVELVEQLDETEAQINAVRDIMQETTFEEMPLLGTETDKTRATMKIQEGCANYCTFCIIPYTRGRLKSRQLDSIIEEAKRLVAHGFSEVVLTGIHLGNYGVDLKERKNLAEVVRALTQVEGLERIRMSSIESVEVSEELTDLMATEKKVCAHLHLPLQAGSDSILKAMNRHYDLAKFEELLNDLRRRIPDIAITTDIIVGFPGETDELFEETIASVKKFGFTHIHAFPYSKREGTPAAKMENQVPEAVKKTRIAVLNALAKESLKTYGEERIGRTETILVERIRNGFYEGFTDSYIHAKLPIASGAYEVGQLASGTAVAMEGEYLLLQ